MMHECNKPKNEKMIAKFRKAHKEAKARDAKGKGAHTAPSTTPATTLKVCDGDGRPLKLNKKGAYVLDQKAYKAMTDKPDAKPSAPASTYEAELKACAAAVSDLSVELNNAQEATEARPAANLSISNFLADRKAKASAISDRLTAICNRK